MELKILALTKFVSMQNNYVLNVKFQNESDEPVMLTEMKKYLRVSIDETYDDDMITQLIKTARQQLEGYLNLSLINKTVIARLQNEAGYMLLPYTTPIIDITGIIDDNGNTLTTDNYSLKADTISIYPASNARPENNFYTGGDCNISTVTYTVGYDEENVLPAQFKTLIMQQTSWLYEHRGDEMELALSPIVKLSAKPYRRVF